MTGRIVATADGAGRSSAIVAEPTRESSSQPGVGPAPSRTRSELLGRRRECAVLDNVLAEARSRWSAAVVVTGEAGSGKSALLDHVRASAVDFQVVRCCGVESEMELPYAGLHQLCSSLLLGTARPAAGAAAARPASRHGSGRADRRPGSISRRAGRTEPGGREV